MTATCPSCSWRKVSSCSEASSVPVVMKTVPWGKHASAWARSSWWQTTRKCVTPEFFNAWASQRAAGSKSRFSSMKVGRPPSRGKNTIAPVHSIRALTLLFPKEIISKRRRKCTLIFQKRTSFCTRPKSSQFQPALLSLFRGKEWIFPGFWWVPRKEKGSPRVRPSPFSPVRPPPLPGASAFCARSGTLPPLHRICPPG